MEISGQAAVFLRLVFLKQMYPFPVVKPLRCIIGSEYRKYGFPSLLIVGAWLLNLP